MSLLLVSVLLRAACYAIALLVSARYRFVEGALVATLGVTTTFVTLVSPSAVYVMGCPLVAGVSYGIARHSRDRAEIARLRQALKP